MATMAFPIGVDHRGAIGIGTARAPSALEAIEPFMERVAGIATIVMRHRWRDE
jgi:hypothetical protein